MNPCLAALVASTLALGSGVAAAGWQPVPGAPDVQVDAASIQHERTKVVAWLRWWGRPAFLPATDVRAVRVHRSTVLAEFDCAQRTLRPLAANGYDSAGTAVFMASTPGPAQPVRGEELGWTYDALCEAARSGGRF